MTDVRHLQAMLDCGITKPAVLYAAMTEPAPEPERRYVTNCRHCGTEFSSALKPKGTKWTSLCWPCLRWET